MVTFRGTFDHTLDAKNRLTVPARYRAALADGLVLAIPVDLEPCVGVWRPDDYATYCERRLAGLPPLSSRLTQLERFFYGRSQDAELDGAGRVMVPGFLATHATLAKDVLIVGVGDHLELWNRERWEDQQQTLLESVAEITAGADLAA